MTVTDDLAAAVGDRLRLDADLRISVDGRPVRLTGAGRRLVLDVGRARDLPLLRGASPRRRLVRDDLGRLATGLDAVGITLDVVDGAGTTLARIGHGADAGVAGRLLGGPVSVPSRTAPLLAIAVVAGALVALGVFVRRSTSGD